MKELIPAGLMGIVVTFVVGFIGGIPAVGGFWRQHHFWSPVSTLHEQCGRHVDNAETVGAGNFGGKGSEAHKAAVIGDTVGDPAKTQPVHPSTPRLPSFLW